METVLRDSAAIRGLRGLCSVEEEAADGPHSGFLGETSSDDRMGRRVDSVQLEAWFWHCGSLGRTARASEAILGSSPNPSH